MKRLNFLRLGAASLVAWPLGSLSARATHSDSAATTDRATTSTSPKLSDRATRRPPSVANFPLPDTPAGEKLKYPPGPSHREHMEWFEVEESGALMGQITSSPLIHKHIYPEYNVFTSDGRFFIYHRRAAAEEKGNLWFCEVGTWRLYKIPQPDHSSYINISLNDPDYIYYLHKPVPKKNRLIRQNIWTGEREEIMAIDGLNLNHGAGNRTPDNRYLFAHSIDDEYMSHIVRIDLVERSWKIIYSREDIHNPHLHIEPGQGKDLLVQHNRGGKYNKHSKRWDPFVGPEGTTLFLIDINGENYRPLPIGKPHTPDIWGHQVWLGNSGKVIATLQGERIVEGQRIYKINYDYEDADGKRGNLVTVSDKEDKPTVIAGGVFFDHIMCTPDGKFFISEDLDGNIFVGSTQTGKYRKLCNTGSPMGIQHYTIPNPFLSPDGKYAFFNSVATGVPQLWGATIPEEFLRSLEI